MTGEHPTMADLIADLKDRGGQHPVWHEVAGAIYGSVLRAALASGKVELTRDGGLKLVSNSKSKSEVKA
jgi:hypothetical protein